MKKKIFLTAFNHSINKLSKERKLEQFMIAVAISGHLAVYIQAFKIFMLKSGYAVSFSAYIFMLFSCLCWLGYGLIKNIKPLVISNIFAIIGITLVLICIIIYKP